MKRCIVTITVLFSVLFPLRATSAPFSPEPLKITAASHLQYGFDAETIEIPLTLEGGPATVMLALFTSDRAASVRDVRSGHLGWHYMNNVDTCFFISPLYQYEPGPNTVTWNGKDDDGRYVPLGVYTYYLWGFGEESAPDKAVSAIRFSRFDRSHFQTRDPDGKPLANPVLFDAPRAPPGDGMQRIVRTKWVIGGDSSDLSLIETTAYDGWAEHSRLALDSADHSRFFTRTEAEQGFEISKFKWVPNGNAELQTDWGNGGRVAFDLQVVNKPVKKGAGQKGNFNMQVSGPVSNGAGSLFFTETWM